MSDLFVKEDLVVDPDKVVEVVKGKSIEITLDTSDKDVLDYDKKGKTLHFNSDIGRFKALRDVVLQNLSKRVRQDYFLAFDEHQQNTKEALNPFRDLNLKVTLPGGGTATSKLDVLNKQKGFHYAWRRPDERGVAEYEGAVPVQKGELNREGKEIGVLSGTALTGSSFTIKDSGGDEELVLYKIPTELYEAKLKEVGDKSRQRNGVVVDATKKEMENSGVTAFIPKENDGRNWS